MALQSTVENVCPDTFQYFSDLSSNKARRLTSRCSSLNHLMTPYIVYSYFRKFVKAWNRGRLLKVYYEGVQSADNPSSASTSYRWSFKNNLQVNSKDLRLAREGVNEATRGSMASANGSSSNRRVQGPSLPGRSATSNDWQYNRELDAERLDREHKASRKRARDEENEQIEDVIG